MLSAANPTLSNVYEAVQIRQHDATYAFSLLETSTTGCELHARKVHWDKQTGR